VLSTLHGGDVATVIARLLDMGIETYSVTSAVRAVLAMRLARRVCVRCGGETGGCEACLGTGYVGRLPIVEFSGVTGGLRKLILASSDREALSMELAKGGMRTLRDRARELVSARLTSSAEVERVLGPEA
jgi:type II secretory ATPase GspE/PulE/Tfp pilus assembly ATPase PilB-like protein